MMHLYVILHMFSSFYQVSSLNSGGFVSVTEATWFKNKCLATKTLLGSLVKLYWICLLTSLTWLERSIPLSGHQPSGTHVVLNGILTPVDLLNQIMVSTKKNSRKSSDSEHLMWNFLKQNCPACVFACTLTLLT